VIYYARSENEFGEKETVSHHLQRTAALCRTFCSALGDEAAGEWMGLFHDFGKYSPLFQRVLTHQEQHIDHALPGAALLYGRLGSKSARFLPLALAVRAHHDRLSLTSCSELTAWLTGKTDGKNPQGLRYSISSAADDACKSACQSFLSEIPLPDRRPCPSAFSGQGYSYFLEWMLYTRLLYSALTDADYTASAEHFQPDYLQQASAPPLDAAAAMRALEEYRSRLQAGSSADPAITALRNRLFESCSEAGKIASPGIYTLTAPTGAGKTLAMLAFALQQLLRGRRRIIFVLPFLSIIEQNAAIYRQLIPQLLESHSQLRPEDEQAARELHQRWDAPCIVTTSVQFFEGLFACSGPDCRRLHQIAESVIIFDEAQSLPVTLAAATLRSLQALSSRWGCTVVFSTATQPAFDALPDVEWQPKELAAGGQALFESARRVNCSWNLQPRLPEEIAAQAVLAPNACIILNLRRHARRVYEALQALRPREEVFLLSTDLCPAHRTAVLSRIRDRLQKGLPCYLAATQCIEAGVDISFDTLFRALAPLEGIIQAAGRCNRHDARRRGQMQIFLLQEETGEEAGYPDAFYRQGANAVRILLERHPIDLYSLSHIQEYYTILYRDGQLHDKPELTRAIENGDFEGAHHEYRLIERAGVPVIVPYNGEQELYEQLCEEAKSGITGGWLRRAAPLSITCYNERLVRDCCEALQTPARRHSPPAFAGCYLLRNPSLYDSREAGLQLDAMGTLIE
jgi:CRISPR-associated endonuclease/helicase Cas3